MQIAALMIHWTKNIERYYVQLPPNCRNANYWTIRTLEESICNDYFVLGGIRTCLGVSTDPMFVWISLNSSPLNLLLVRSHQADRIILKHPIQGRNNVTMERVEPRSCDHGRRKNDAFTLSAMLLPKQIPKFKSQE